MAEKPAYRYIPLICRDYNTKTCTREDCTRPHLCYKHFHPGNSCTNRKECSLSHDIFNPQAKQCLEKAGFNVKTKPGDVKKEYIEALKELTSVTRKKKDLERSPVVTHPPQPQRSLLGRHPNQMIPRPCLNYNQALCTNPVCDLLHLCQAYVEGTCKNSYQTCCFSHNIFDPGVRAKLRDCGLKVDQKPKDVLAQYRAALKGTVGVPHIGRLAAQMRSMSAMDVRGPKKSPVKQHRHRPRSQERRMPVSPLHDSSSTVATNSDNSDSSVYDEGSEGESKEAKVQKKKPKKRGQRVKKKGQQASSGQAQSEEAVGSSKPTGLSAKAASQESVSQPRSSGKAGNRNLHVSVLDDANICLYFLNGSCAYGEDCRNHHQLLPYVWQYKTLQQGVKWAFFSKNNVQLLEQSYCNVQTKSCPVIVEGQMFSVDFNTMFATTNDMSIPVRRLSTDSYVNENKDQPFSTRWTWYWESDEGWVPCGQKDLQGEKKQFKKLQTQLEEAYLTNPVTELSVKINGFPYSIDFSSMKQKNMRSNTERRLRRRPVFVSPDEVQKVARQQELATQKVKMDSASVNFPSDWKPMGTEDMITVNIPVTSTDYASIRDIFLMSMPNTSIILIKRVQNRSLWFTFQMKADKLRREYGPELTIERRLFHGTIPEAVDPICEQNFDWRLYGSAVGARYGKGAYFAVQASKADQYVKPDKYDLRFMFYARVLVGRTTKGGKTMRRPPQVDEANPNKLFDSCTDDPHNPSLYVLFDKDQYYPEFIICYKVNVG